MNIKQQFKLSIVLMIGGLLFGIIETIYFGWNYYPQSTAEKVCDFISLVISDCGNLLFLSCIITFIKNFIK